MHYWDRLAEARRLLDAGDFRQAEHAYNEARRLRDQSPGRVLLTETLGDTAKKMWRGLRNRTDDAEGRWTAETADFVAEFHRHAEDLIEATATRSASGDPTTTLDYRTLTTTVYLLSVSDLTSQPDRDPAQLVVAALRSAMLNDIMPPIWLIPEQIAYGAHYRLQIADAVIQLLQKHQNTESPEDVAKRMATVQRIIAPEHFLSAPQLEAERAWLVACLVDRPPTAPLDIVAPYREFLALGNEPSDQRDTALLRCVSILANADDFHLDMPDYVSALNLCRRITPHAQSTRLQLHALTELIDRRKPAGERVWASAHDYQDGTCIVLWDQERPCDIVFQTEATDSARLTDFLSGTAGIVSAGAGNAKYLPSSDIEPYIEVLHEPSLPSDGCQGDLILNLAHGLLPDWDLGIADAAEHPLLGSGSASAHPSVARALAVGLAWLSCLDVLRRSHSGLRDGIHRLARSGDTAARLLHDFMDPELLEQQDWQLLPLDERASPQVGFAADDANLPHNRFTDHQSSLIYTGQPAQVALDWSLDGTGSQLVVDSPERLQQMSGFLNASPYTTVLPLQGVIHNRLQALSCLENGWFNNQTRIENHAFLPLLHWCRISRTHNGDLGDFALLRPRATGALPLHDAYRHLLAEMPVDGLLAADPDAKSGDLRSWTAELSTRAARSEIVAGWLEYLPDAGQRPPASWGATERDDRAWIFCDSAAIHWRMIRAGLEPRRVHGGLAAGGSRHLSLATSGIFLNDDLSSLLSEWLVPFGKLEKLKLQDVRPPLLRLAGSGIDPDARVDLPGAGAAMLDYLRKSQAGGASLSFVLPQSGVLAVFLRAVAAGEVSADISTNMHFMTPDHLWNTSSGPDLPSGRRLLVPMLEAFSMTADVDDDQDLGAWPAADRQRQRLLTDMRRLCALEVNALTSLGCHEIEILDPRWHRRFPFPDKTDAQLFPLPILEAVQLAAGDSAMLCDLPAPSARPTGRQSFKINIKRETNLLDTARNWFAVQGWLGENGLGLPPGLPVGVQPAQSDNTGLIIGNTKIQATWHRMLIDIHRAREAGQLDAWVLVVSETPQPGLIELRDAFMTPQSTALNLDAAANGFGPVFRVDPVSLCDARTRQLLKNAKPTMVWAGDIAEWLPGSGKAADLYAPAIRLLLHQLDGPVCLYASDLSDIWQKFLAIAGGNLPPDTTGTTAAAEERDNLMTDLKPVAVGRIEHPEITCPACGQLFKLMSLDESCPACSLLVGIWLTVDERQGLLDQLQRNRILGVMQALQRDTGDTPICVWHGAHDKAQLRAAVIASGLNWRTHAGRTLPAGVVGNEILLCDYDDFDTPPRECRHFLLGVSVSLRELNVFRQTTAGDVMLWYHPLALSLRDSIAGCAECRSDGEKFNRMLEDLTLPTLEEPWRWQGVVPARFQELATGHPAPLVRRALGVQSWLSVVKAEAGESESRGRAQAIRPDLQLRLSRMEVEFRLEKLRSELPVLLNAALPENGSGTLTVIQLDALPLEIEAQDLAWFDRFLLSIALVNHDPRFQYHAPDGFLSSTVRVVGLLGDRGLLLDHLWDVLDRLLSAVIAISAVPASEAPEIAQDLLLVGTVLGVWQNTGDGSGSDLDLDLSVPRKTQPLLRETAAQLLAELNIENLAWRRQLCEAWRIGFLEDLQRRPSPPRSGRDSSAPIQQVLNAALMVDEFLKGGQSGLKVIQGQVGTGRVEAVIRGLDLALSGHLRVGDIQIYCADIAAAADFHVYWRELCPGRSLPRILVGAGGAETSLFQPGGCIAYHRHRAVGIIVETQRHEPTDRFRIAQRYRQGRLLHVFNPVDAGESAEHVFLNTPDRADIHVMPNSIRHSQKLHTELNDLVEMIDRDATRGKARLKRRGRIVSRHADNLEDALTFLTTDFKQSGEGHLLDVVAPVQDDLIYLGRAVARLGWLPVFRRELDSLLMPGITEYLAMALDAVQGRTSDDHHDMLLLPRLVSDISIDGYLDWLTKLDDVMEMPLDVFWTRARIFSGDRDMFLGRERTSAVTQVLQRQRDGHVGGLLEMPLVEAWRQVISGLPGIASQPASGPVMTLSTPEEVPVGRGAPRAIFCLGTESPRHHYRLLAGAADPVYVLYKVQSPLVGDLAGET
jgi:hypothetical protein